MPKGVASEDAEEQRTDEKGASPENKKNKYRGSKDANMLAPTAKPPVGL